MSVETVKNAIGYYFRIFFCPDYDIDIYWFYESLIYDNITTLNSPFPLETVLRTLVRVSLDAKEKKLMVHHNVANSLLDKVGTILNLQYKEIVGLTSPASQLIDFTEQDSLRKDPTITPCE